MDGHGFRWTILLARLCLAAIAAPLKAFVASGSN
jgi:hypothetical protein